MNDGSRFFAWFDATVDAAPAEIKSAMESHGFTAHHTGGGCMAYSVTLPNGMMIRLSADDCLPESLDSFCAWMVEDNDDWYLQGGARLRDLLATYKTIAFLGAMYRAAHIENETEYSLPAVLDEAEEKGATDESERPAIEAILKAWEG